MDMEHENHQNHADELQWMWAAYDTLFWRASDAEGVSFIEIVVKKLEEN